MPTGTVKFYNAQRGYGFIRPDKLKRGQKDVWMGKADLQRAGVTNLIEGQPVEYESTVDGHGRTNVTELKVIALSRQKGVVEAFDSAKGYGFIHPCDGSKNVFVHISAVKRAGLAILQEGQSLEYEVVTHKGGKQSAENLKVSL